MKESEQPWDLERRERFRSNLLEIGFDVARFTDCSRVPVDRLRSWLSAGLHADMEWIARGEEKRGDPGRVLPGARTLVLLGVNYLRNGVPPEGNPRWARYALHNDYHDTVLAGLRKASGILVSEGIPATEHRYYVDTGPLLERGWAARAGMGFLGKNAMLISRDHGNWLFLAAILLPSTIPADPPLGGARAFDTDGGARIGLNCGSCTRCIEACPTQALPQPGLLDARRCISYHTIENKGIVPRDLRAAFGNRIYGCDTCLEVCPWNRFAQAGRALLLEARPALADLCLEELLRMTPERFAVTFKGTAIKRIKLRGLLRNACIVAGNRGDSGLVPALEELGAGAEALVRAHAVWALRRIGGPEAESALSRLRATETDPTVLEEFSGPLVSTVA